MAANPSWREQADAKQKHLELLVSRAMAVVRHGISDRKPRVRESLSYGAIGIDPKHLVIWYVFEADADKALAMQNGLSKEIEQRSRDALRVEGYPGQAIDLIHVAFASDEEIRRAGGFRGFFA